MKAEVVLHKIQQTRVSGARHLDLSFCFLTTLPPELFELTHLLSLDISGNYLYDLPDEINRLDNLVELDLSYNFLEIHSLIKIRRLFEISRVIYRNNPFVDVVPPEIFRKSLHDIVSYHQYTTGSPYISRLNEAKVLFVGNGEVGKTSIMKKLLEPQRKLKIGTEPTTHGISIKNWSIYCRLPAKRNFEFGTPHRDQEFTTQEINLNLWDFGGQEIYHSTHQFFLTRRSIYIFIWEARKEEDYTVFDYWLNIIKYLSDNSPVIVVMNKSDVRTKEIDEQTLRKKFPNISHFLKVSCAANKGLAALKAAIEMAIGMLPHINSKVPSSWQDIKMELGWISRDYISPERYYTLCAMYGVDQKQAQFLSEYFHDLGTILHFANDSILSNTIILNPEWATKAVYSLIDSRNIQDNNGKFSFHDLKKILDKRAYPSEKHLELIRLMEKFEIAFNLLGTTSYIIPELLSNSKPDYPFQNFDQSRLSVEFRYSFMPSGIIGRLICRLHHLIPGNLFWKNGMVLSYEVSDTVILSENINKKLIIKINDIDASQILSIVRHELQIIHDSLNLKRDLDYSEMIPCNCSECSRSASPEFYRYTTLRKYFFKGKTTVTCERSVEEVDLNQLMNGYEAKHRDNDLLYLIMAACSRLQGHKKIIEASEDSRNAFIASLLDTGQFTPKDQTRWGSSATGIKEGELDIKVENRNKIPLSIFEAFTLKTFNRKVIINHLDKLFTYDPNGLKENYLVIYNERANFDDSWNKYLKLLAEVEFKYPLLRTARDVSDRYAYGSEIRIGCTIHNRSGVNTKLYHLMVNLAD